VLTAVDAAAYLTDQALDGSDAANGRRLEDNLNPGVGAGDAPRRYRPFFLPLEAKVRQFCQVRHRQADGQNLLADTLVVCVKADIAALERGRIEGPAAIIVDDGPALSVHPSAVILAGFELHHGQSSAAGTGDVDVGERRSERRQ